MPPALADAIFWVALACCVVAQVAILRSALAVLRRPPADAPAGVPLPRRGVEIVWAVLPAVALAGVLALTWRAVQSRSTAPGAPAPAAEVSRS